MYSKVLDSGLHFMYGAPTVDLINEVAQTSILAVRPCDVEELADSLRARNFTNEDIASDFGNLLTMCLGLQREESRAYGIMDSFVGPVFVATLTRVGSSSDGVCVMSGFAKSVGYILMTRRQIFDMALCVFEQLLNDLQFTFKSNLAICHVKASNKDTIRTWQWLQKRYAEDARNVRISITDDPFTKKPYKMVTLQIGNGD